MHWHNLCDLNFIQLTKEGKQMKWLEMIKFRTSGQNLENMVDKFIKPLTKDYEGAGLISMQVYSHATLNTDLSIHLYWDTVNVSQQKPC